jgi:hypothetical protein
MRAKAATALTVIALWTTLSPAQPSMPALGEHLNGLPWEAYEGPTTIESDRVDRVQSAVVGYLRMSSKAGLMRFVLENGTRPVERVGPIYMAVPGGGDSDRRVLVVIEYRRGLMSFCFYQNQILVGFVFPDERGVNHTFSYFLLEQCSPEGPSFSVKDEVCQ